MRAWRIGWRRSWRSPDLDTFALSLRRSTFLGGVPALCVVVALHLLLRTHEWEHEWYWTVDSYAFVTVLFCPIVAGLAAWDGIRWGKADESLVSSGRPARAVVAEVGPSVTVSTAIYLAGLGVVLTWSGLVGDDSPAIGRLTLATLPGLSLAASAAMVGFAAGRRWTSVLVPPVATVLTFATLLFGYTTLPESLLRIGGATATLLALTPDPVVYLAQSLFYLTCGAFAIALAETGRMASIQSRSLRWIPGVAALAMCVLLIGRGGMRFQPTSVSTTCGGVTPRLCLHRTYEFLRPSYDLTTIAFDRFSSAGFDPPELLSQDPGEVEGHSNALRIGTSPLTASDVTAILVSSIVPAECDIFRDRETYAEYLDAVYWVESLLGVNQPDPTVSPEVAAGDGPVARNHVAAIEIRLSTCTS